MRKTCGTCYWKVGGIALAKGVPESPVCSINQPKVHGQIIGMDASGQPITTVMTMRPGVSDNTPACADHETEEEHEAAEGNHGHPTEA